ncbi:MAG: AAA family ATPase [Magnetococcales bacterium]|nr:AAA family ATPase [Magnetococcales bacterium]
MFTRLELTNFTVFESLDIDLSPGINVFVGANGTGKTHLLKLMYCILASGYVKGDPLMKKIINVFRPESEDIMRLTTRKNDSNNTNIFFEWNGNTNNISWSKSPILSSPTFSFKLSSPVYIPVKEMLSFAPGFISLYDKYELEFDELYPDMLRLAYFPRLKNIPKGFLEILEIIPKLIHGEVIIKGEKFYLQSLHSDIEMSLVSEGFRKLALIWQLIRNGSIQKGTTLFWDEPEANMNPSLMQHVSNILIMLANRGIQIFVATHDYAFLKELDYQKQQTPVTYFSLDTSEENGVQANACFRYTDISPNRIAEENLRIYDLEIKRSLGVDSK